jgi:hypothetical protein
MAKWARKRYKKARKLARRRWKARAAAPPHPQRTVTVTRHRKPPRPFAPRVAPRWRKLAMRLDAFRMRRWWKHGGTRPGRPMAPPPPAAVSGPVHAARPGSPLSPSAVLNGKVVPPPSSDGSPARGRTHMSGSGVFAPVEEAVDQHIGGWDPDEAQDIEEFFAGLPDHFRTQGQTYLNLADRMASELPIAGPVREMLAEVGSAYTVIAEAAEEAYNAHRAEHEKELERVENPRPGEPIWNV